MSISVAIAANDDMERKFLDVTIYESRNLSKDGNIDFRYWHNKTNDERVHAAGIMMSVAFGEPDFFKKKVDRNVYSARKQKL